MTKLDIWEAFEKLFPDFAENVIGYSKIGSKTLKVVMEVEDENEETRTMPLIFLYNNDTDWTFGTRVWRQKPLKKREIIKPAKAFKAQYGEENA